MSGTEAELQRRQQTRQAVLSAVQLCLGALTEWDDDPALADRQVVAANGLLTDVVADLEERGTP